MMTGKELEQKLNIPQQYRSRTDKQFSNFVSPANVAPRQYTDTDVLVYEIIFSAREQKLTRPDILAKLVNMVNSGLIPFYPDSRIKAVTDVIVSKSEAEITATITQTEGEHKPVIRHRKPDEKKVSGYEMAEKIGNLSAKLEMQSEEISDLSYEVKELQNQLIIANSAIAEMAERLEVIAEMQLSKPQGFFDKLFNLFK